MNQGGLTTHVLDTARGWPAAGLRVTVEARAGDGWRPVGGGVTDADGRVPGLVAEGALAAGEHRLTFATGDWFEAEGLTGFYPLVTVVCHIEDPGAHYHVPLLLSPYGYSTYRGS
jgi:5-hydroxyisourate hydrolase